MGHNNLSKINSFIRPTSSKYLISGITDKVNEKDWRTFKGASLTFEKWDTGEPNDSYGQDYAAYWMPANKAGWQTKVAMAWDDVGENQYCGVFCEITACSGGK